MSLRWLIALVLVFGLIVVGGAGVLIAYEGQTPEGCVDPPECTTFAVP